MKKKRTCEPIQLSGRVYFKGFLAEIAGSPLPATVLTGDIRLHNVPKSGSRPRYGQTVEFAGFFSASVYDGKTWRRLLMRKHAAVDATYIGVIERRDKAYACRRHLISLGGKTASWVESDAGYEVVYQTASSTVHKEAPAPKTVAPAKAEVAVVTSSGAADGVHVQVNVHVHHPAPPALKPRRKSRRKAVHPGQLSLFDAE